MKNNIKNQKYTETHKKTNKTKNITQRNRKN